MNALNDKAVFIAGGAWGFCHGYNQKNFDK